MARNFIDEQIEAQKKALECDHNWVPDYLGASETGKREFCLRCGAHAGFYFVSPRRQRWKAYCIAVGGTMACMIPVFYFPSVGQPLIAFVLSGALFHIFSGAR